MRLLHTGVSEHGFQRVIYAYIPATVILRRGYTRNSTCVSCQLSPHMQHTTIKVHVIPHQAQHLTYAHTRVICNDKRKVRAFALEKLRYFCPIGFCDWRSRFVFGWYGLLHSVRGHSHALNRRDLQVSKRKDGVFERTRHYAFHPRNRVSADTGVEQVIDQLLYIRRGDRG